MRTLSSLITSGRFFKQASRIVTGVFCLLLWLTLVQPAVSEGYPELMKKGTAAFQEEDYNKAAVLFEKALKKKKTADAYRFFGHSNYHLERYGTAVEAYRNALKKKPSLKRVHLYLARIYMEEGRRERALGELQSLLLKGGTHEGLYRMYGKLLERGGQYHLALEMYREAYFRAKEGAEYLEKLVELSLKTQNPARALEYSRTLIRNHPDEPRYFLFKAQSALLQNRNALAATALEKARFMGSTRKDLYRTLGDLQREKGHYREAVHYYSFYFSNQENPTAEDRYRMGAALLKTDQLSAAREQLSRAARQDPSYVNGLVRLARIHYLRSGFQEAKERLKEALKLAPENSSALSLLGNLSLKEKKPDEAVKYFSALYRNGRRSRDFLYNYSIALRKTNRQRELLEVLTEAIMHHPDDDGFYKQLDRVFRKRR